MTAVLAMHPTPTAAAIAALLEGPGGMRLLHVRADLVIVEKAVPGELHQRRRVAAQWCPESGWRAGVALLVTHQHSLTWKCERIAETTITDLDEFALWVGGQLSRPTSEREVAALVGER